jgi:hypothetical protein
MSDNQQMGLTIWFLCGIILGVFGLTVTISGIFNAFNPPPVFGTELHLDIVWGLVLLVAGVAFMILQRPSKIRTRQLEE